MENFKSHNFREKSKGKAFDCLICYNKRLNVHIEVLWRCHHPEALCKKDVLTNFEKLTGNHLCQSLFFHKVAEQGVELYWKRDSGTGDFPWIFQNI